MEVVQDALQLPEDKAGTVQVTLQIDGLLASRGVPADAPALPGPVRNTPQLRAMPSAPWPSPLPAGNTGGPCPIPPRARHGRPGARPDPPSGRQPALPEPRRCAYAGPAAAPGADCGTRPRG